MSIFSRIGEIVNANISAMLDRAENPEKMVRLMIHEMEDTLTEVKSSAAEVIADRIRTERKVKECLKNEQEWEARAKMAVEKGRDDLAREALERKLSYRRQAEEVTQRLAAIEETVRQYHQDIAHLEEKLSSAYRRQKELDDKRKQLESRRKVEERMHQINHAGAFAKFEEYAGRIDRMEADLEVNRHRSGPSLEDQFQELEHSGEVEAALAALKKKRTP